MDPKELENQLNTVWNKLETKSLSQEELQMLYLIEEHPNKFKNINTKINTMCYFMPCLESTQVLKLGKTMINMIWMNRPKNCIVLKILPIIVNKLEYGIEKQYSIGIKSAYLNINELEI